MIARVTLPLGTLYMALWRRPSGEWVPIGAALAAQDALRLCIEHLREHLGKLTAQVASGLQCANDNLARLCDAPQAGDRVVIGDTARALDDEGVLALPEWRSFPVTLGATVHQALVDIDSKVGDPRPLIGDYILNEPLELLAIVARHRPELLGPLAAYMASTHEATRPSKPAESEGNGGGA